MFIFYSYAHDFYFHSNIPTHYPHLHLFYVTMMGFAFLWLALWFAIYITFASKSAIMFHTMRWMCTSSKTFLSHLSGSSPIYLKITHTCVQNLREIHSTRAFFMDAGARISQPVLPPILLEYVLSTASNICQTTGFIRCISSLCI